MITARDINGTAIYATRDENGVAPEAFCPCCRKRMRARVGDVRIPHWAHESGERCDEWWEEESEWRNSWMQLLAGSDKVDVENILEKNGERHFYDARFAGKQIAIFRRKRLSPEMLAAREQFFGDMFWFVEGTVSEYERFSNHLADKKIVAIPNAQRCYMCFARLLCSAPFYARWSDCSQPVVFDFASASEDDDYPLWCVLPLFQGRRFVLELPKDNLLQRLKDTGSLLRDDVEVVQRRILGRVSQPPVNHEPSQTYASRIDEKRKLCSRTSTDLSSLIISDFPQSQRKSQQQPQENYLPPTKSFDELAAEYRRLGYSQADAEARARMQT